jgi:DNA-directed RNA polymerase specialized sigma24 family protein
VILDSTGTRVRTTIGCAGAADPLQGDPAPLVVAEECWSELEDRVDLVGKRARQVWDGIARGQSQDEIATEMGVAGRTVRRWKLVLRQRLRNFVFLSVLPALKANWR